MISIGLMELLIREANKSKPDQLNPRAFYLACLLCEGGVHQQRTSQKSRREAVHKHLRHSEARETGVEKVRIMGKRNAMPLLNSQEKATSTTLRFWALGFHLCHIISLIPSLFCPESTEKLQNGKRVMYRCWNVSSILVRKARKMAGRTPNRVSYF